MPTRASTSFRFRRRGSILIVTLVMMLLLMIVGAGLILRGLKTNQGMSQMTHYAASMSCADGARSLITATLSAYANPANLTVQQAVLGETLQTGHYDAFNIKSVSGLSGNAVSGGGPNGIANNLNGPSNGQPFVFTVVCQDSSGQNRMTEVEYIIQYGLP